MKKLMKEKKFSSTALLVVFCMVVGLFATFSSPEAATDQYQIIYDMVEEGIGRRPMTLEDVYTKYGAMNGDYYKIALERELKAPDGICTIAPLTLLGVTDELEKNGAISNSMRTKLRKSVETYGLECHLPDDPDFIEGTTETPTPTHTDISGTGWTDQEIQDMIESGQWTGKPSYIAPQPSPDVTLSTNRSVFADVDSDAWYAEAVNHMVETGIIKGKDDGLFHPDDTITIAEWCTLIYRIAYKEPVERKSCTIGSTTYNHWAADAINRCCSADLTEMFLTAEAYPEGGPVWDALAQRGEAMTAVSRILMRMQYGNAGAINDWRDVTIDGSWTWDDIPDASVVLQGTTPSSTTSMGFVRYEGTHFWDPQMVLNAYNFGFVNGTDSTGTCNPTGLMTRAQACQMLYKAGLDHNVGVCEVIRGGIM